MNRIRLLIISLLGLFGIYLFVNPPMTEKQEEEHWTREEELLEAKLRTYDIQERISDKRDKLNTGDKSLIEKAREEWDKE